MSRREWLARWAGLVWQPLTVTLLTFLNGVVTVGQRGLAPKLEPGFVLMAGVVVVVTGVLARVSLPLPPTLVRGVIFTVALIPATMVMLQVVVPRGLYEWGLGRAFALAVGLSLIAATFDAIIGSALRNWREASRVRADLEQSLAQESRLNLLLVEAERDRFANYAHVLQVEVSDGLDEVAERAPRLSDVELADAINGFVSRVMRPLAHLLHPVTVRAGLIPALRALGPRFDVRADAQVEADDARGILLDEHVRHQTYRWLRHVQPANSVTTITFACEADVLTVVTRGMGSSRPLDAIQRVAGLRLVGADTLIAPLAGAASPDVTEPTDSVPVQRRRPLRMPSLAAAPVISLPLVLLMGLVSLAVQTYLAPPQLGPADFLANVVSFASALVVALVLRAAPVPTSPRAASLWVLGCWLAIGLAAALSAALVVLVLSPTAVDFSIVASILVRGILRYVLAGVIFQAARGYAAQAEADGERVRDSIAARRRERERVLGLTDRLDRLISESLHRSVQGRLAAASLLAAMGRRDEAMRELEGIRTTTLPVLIEQLSSADLNSALAEDSATTRSGILDDRVDWDALERWQPQVGSDLRKVVGECVVNAQRHGGAGRVVASVTHDGHQVVLRCVDDGVWAQAQVAPGLGSQIFDEVAARHGGSWSLERTSDGTVFTMRLVAPVPVG